MAVFATPGSLSAGQTRHSSEHAFHEKPALRRGLGGVRQAARRAKMGAAFAALALAASGGTAAGAGVTFVGGGASSNWSDDANWSPAAHPVDGDDIVLAQTGTHAPSNFDINVNANSLTLNTATDATTHANGYIVSNGGGIFGLVSGGSILDNAANAVADQLNMGIALNGPASITVASGATGLNIGGVISGTGPLTVTNNSGASALQFLANNTYTGTTTIAAGTLQLGNGGTTGSINGPVVDNGSLAIDHSNAVTIGYSISGTGSLQQIGSGTTTITANETYGGGTTISAGALQIGNGGTTGSITGDVLNNSSLIFNRSDAYTFGGSITGSGSVTQNGSGTLTLGGTSLYSGGTTINAGALAVSADANLGAPAGGIAINNGSELQITSGFTTGRNISLGAGTEVIDVVANPNPNLIINGVISGAGGLNKTGGGELVLTQNETYLGGTTISGGVLSLGAAGGSSSGMVVGNIVDNSSLFFNRTDASLSYGNVISGTGTVSKYQSGTLIFTADQTYTGGTLVQSGTLQLGNGGTAGMVYGSADTLDVNGIVTAFGTGISLATSTSVVFDHSNNITYAGDIIGAGSLVKNNSNTLVLTGLDYYSGGTTINGGTLQIGDGSNFRGAINSDVIINSGTLAFDRGDTLIYGGVISGATGAVTQIGAGTTVLTGASTYGGGTTISAGTLQIGLGGTTGSITGNVIDNGTLAFKRSDSITFGGVISGTGVVNQIGSGTLTLTGANTYNGGTNIKSGILSVSSEGNLGSGGVVALSPNATLKVTSTGTFTHAATIAGISTFNIAPSTTTTWNGAISDGTSSGMLSVAGGGTLVLGAANSFSGGTRVIGGSTLGISADSALGASTGALTLGDAGTAGTLAVSSSFTLGSSRPVSLGAGGGTINTASGQTFTVGQAISGGGALTVGGAGTLVLAGANSYSGGTTISAGTLQIGNGGTTGSITGNVLDNSVLAFDRSDSTTYGGIISGSGEVDQIGSGTLVLTGTNTYSGGTKIEAGTLSISSDANLGSGGIVAMSAGTTLRVTATNTFTHGVTLDGDPTFSVAPATTTTWNGVIADGPSAGTLEVTGGGKLVLGASNTYSGGTIVKGNSTLSVGADVNLGASTGSLALGDASSSGTLAVTSGFTLGASRAVSLGAGGGTINTAAAQTFTVGQGITGSGALTVAGPGTLVFTGANTYGGGTTISAGTLQIGNGGTTGSITGNVVDNATLVFDRSNTLTFAGLISGTGAVAQIGGGTTILTANNTYAGGTTISSGVLQLGNGGTTGGVTGNILDNASLSIDRSDTLSLAGIISGSGSLSQDGTGTTVLLGNDTYAGGTTINFGTLQIGANGTTGSIVGNVLDNAILAFNRSDTYTYGGVVSGTGALNQIGSGTTILTGANTYGGGTTISAGTLQLGSGGTTGSIGGNVTDNGALVFNHSDNITFAGLVSGTGALRQIGGGTTTLTADNTYGGGTTISAGTLQLGNGGTSGSIAGDVLDNAALAFDRSDTLTFAGIVSGTGALNQIGSGTTILTGANSYSGGTTISAGALQIGNGGTSGSIAGDVLDNASLVFDRSDSVTAPGAITGSGSLTQLGSGTTILTGANSYAGGTTISAGTLQLGSGGSSGSIGGDVTDNGTLAFDRSNNFAFAGIISGSGGVHQFGGGTTTLSATNTYNGGTVIDNGMLLLAGSIASSSVSVNNGGIFAGSGNLAGLSVNSGGTVSPGNGGVGTLNVGGNLTMAANSTYIYDVSPASNDLLQVTGTASLNGTLVINPTGIAPGSAVYHVVDSGGLSGTFTAVTLAPGSPLTLLPELTYGPNDATLQFLVTVSSVLTGGGPLTIGNGNNGDVAGAIDFAIAYDGANVFLPLASLTPSDLAAVLEQMTGEVNVGLKSVALRSTSSFVETMLDPTVGARTNLGSGAFAMAAADMSAVRLAANGANDAGTGGRSGPQFTAWAAATGEQDSGDGDVKLGTHKTTATEFSGEFGLDYAFSPGGAAGVAVGFGNDDWDLDTDLGNGNASFYQLGAYFSERFAKNFYFDAAYTYAHFNVTTDREVDFQGVNKYRADFNTTSQAARFEFGHIFTIERGQALSPYIRFQATDISTPNYEEVTTAGSSAYALSFTRNRHFDYTTELGAAWDDVLSSGNDSFTGLRARLGWLHDFGNTLSDTATFSAFNGASFKVYGVSPAANAAHLMVGIEHDIGPVALSLNTEETFAGDAQSYGGTASISVHW